MSTQWANIGEDAGALHALLARIPQHIALQLIDYVWIFPPRRVAAGESIVVVIGAFDEDRAARRVITARFTVSRDRRGTARVEQRIDEHGTAPAEAVPRIVQGVLRRLGEDVEAEPRAEQISGEQERWAALIVELGGRPPLGDAHPPAAGTTPDSTGAAAEPPPSTDETDHRAAPRPAVEPSDPAPTGTEDPAAGAQAERTG